MGSEGPTNRLADEKSDYLRQHMRNPVDWYPWGAEALTRAREEDRPLLVSIGYSACHWCHVMERESFEDRETAELMNRLFVNVKVDREERPDVDQVYMDTVVGLTGHGGWPLTVFCLPDGTPFYGGTYYPPEPRHGMPAFRQVLVAVEDAYRNRQQEVRATGEQILSALSRQPSGAEAPPEAAESVVRAAQRLLQRADPDHGGFGGAPKFPTPVNHELLLAACDVLPERKAREALEHVVRSCHEMARGGIYDHLAGGFHRYSVDASWGVPHFEKMLYDQGQLLSVYAEAWRRSGDDDLLWPVAETAAFLRSEMTDDRGGFFASIDADSEGEEGTFYVWTPAQVERGLGAEAAPGFCTVYGVSERGNFERGTTVLRDVARDPRGSLAAERERLRVARAKRPPPAIDRKRVAGWNAMTVSGLARAGSLLEDAGMLDDAAAAAEFVLGEMTDAGGRLYRVWNGGRSDVPAFLDDHAALLAALLDLHRAGVGSLDRALAVADAIAQRFFDPEASDCFLTPADAEPLVHRPRSDHDGATPHSTGLAALGLVRVAAISGRDDLRTVSEALLRTHAEAIEQAGEAYPTLCRAALLAERGLSLAVVVGDPEDAATRALAARARCVLPLDDHVLVAAPDATLPGVDPSWLANRTPIDDKPTAWVCRGVTCTLPVDDPAALAPLAE